MTTEDVTLKINGKSYSGWQNIRVTRGIDKAVGDFGASVSEHWWQANKDLGWQIQTFNPFTLYAGDDLLMTGYIDRYEPSISGTSHVVNLAGKSMTTDLVECTCELDGSQFNEYKLDAIARAVCAPFGISVQVPDGVDFGSPSDTRISRGETAFGYLERLGRQCGVLLCDNEQGNLVLTNAGDTTNSTNLVMSKNVYSASCKYDVQKRFSKYICRSQTPIQENEDDVMTGIYAESDDNLVPRYRPHSIIAESALDEAMAQRRVNWMNNFAMGKSLVAKVAVEGWRDGSGSLWKINQMVPVNIPQFSMNLPLLIVKVNFAVTNQGFITELELGRVEGYTPDPGQVKVRKGAGVAANFLNDLPANAGVIKGE